MRRSLCMIGKEQAEETQRLLNIPVKSIKSINALRGEADSASAISGTPFVDGELKTAILYLRTGKVGGKSGKTQNTNLETNH